MKLTIAQIDKILWQGEAQSVTVPGADGEMTVLSHHMPLVTTLKKGVILVKDGDSKATEYHIDSGFIEVGKMETVILI